MWIVLIAALLVTSCGRDRYIHRWNDRVLEVGKLHDAGELDEAQRRYEELLENAPGHEERRYVLNELARIAERRGDWHTALDRYEQVYSQEYDDEAGARATYRSAKIVTERLGETERGRRLLRQTVTRYPASVSAEFSVRELAERFRDRGEFSRLEQYFDELYVEVEDQPVADNLLFALGMTLEEHADDEAGALAHYRTLYTNYPDGGLSDDALWQAAMIHKRHQRWPQAIELLETLADDVETSWFVGSYNSPWTNDARFELGLIHLLFLDDYDAAIEHFERYLSDFPHSVETDDAAWHIVEAHRLMGDKDGYRRAMEDFIEQYPESRFVRQATQRLAEEANP